MNRSAVLHIPMSQYAYGTDEEHIVIRLRAGRGDLTECRLHYGDRACRLTPVLFTEQKMAVVAQTEEFDYWETTLEHPYKRLCYYFTLSDGREEVLYYGERFTDHTVDDRSEYYQLPFNHRADIVTPPEWAQDTIIYNIFPDSFATEYRYLCGRGEEKEWGGVPTRGKLGGTIRGICENVEYLKNLGVNAVYINPIFVAGEYHKYDLLDYFHIDPCFGTDDDFHRLIDVFHANGLKVIIDGVFNHCGWYFFAFDDVVKKGESSEYANWFYQLQFPVIRPATEEEKPTYSCFAYERKMPKLNSSNPEERAYFMEVCRYWIREFKVDGWRLDVANEVDRGFWRDFRRAAHEENPESVMIGEIWESSETWLNGDMFDSTMNYDFRKNCRDFFALRKISAEEFHDRIVKMLLRYRTGMLRGQLNLLDSHDVNRFLSYCEGDLRRFRLAEVFLFTSPGIPCVFYGDELGMDGSSETTLRGPMPWEKVQDGEDDFFSRLIAIRKEHEELTYGDYTLRYMDHDGGYIYQRTWGDHKITVCLNNGSTTIDLREYLGKGSVLLSESYEAGKLGSMGYAIIEEK